MYRTARSILSLSLLLSVEKHTLLISPNAKKGAISTDTRDNRKGANRWSFIARSRGVKTVHETHTAQL